MSAWRFVKAIKTEVKIVLAALLLFIFLPAISVVVVAASGIQVVGNSLASLNPVTHLVELFDTNGNKTGELELTTNWPTRGYISDEFGTWDLFRKDMGLGRHTGIDIANSKNIPGEPITPFMDGWVMQVHPKDDGNNCGIYMKIRHEHNITSLYCHMQQVVNIPEYTYVKPGDIIGYMGSTGAATGVHTHFQVAIYDIPVNPRIFMVGEPEPSSVTVASH